MTCQIPMNGTVREAKRRAERYVEAMVEIKKRKFAVCDVCVRERNRLISLPKSGRT